MINPGGSSAAIPIELGAARRRLRRARNRLDHWAVVLDQTRMNHDRAAVEFDQALAAVALLEATPAGDPEP